MRIRAQASVTSIIVALRQRINLLDPVMIGWIGGIIGVFIVGALFRKVNVYEAFIEGAKSGVDVTIKIIP